MRTVTKINEAVEKAMLKVPDFNSKLKTYLDLFVAIEHLNSIGNKYLHSLLYKMTMGNSIPFEKFGRRITFDANNLTQWVESKKQKHVNIAGNISQITNFLNLIL